MKTAPRTQRLQKLVTVSPRLYQLGKQRADGLGLTFPEYLRHLLVTAIENETQNIPMVDQATEKRIGQSLKEYKAGKYTSINPNDEDALDRLLGLK